jgi:hypothetical protein
MFRWFYARFFFCLFHFSPLLPNLPQPHFTSTSGGRYDAQGKCFPSALVYFEINCCHDTSGIPGWYGHGLYFSEHLQTAQVSARQSAACSLGDGDCGSFMRQAALKSLNDR